MNDQYSENDQEKQDGRSPASEIASEAAGAAKRAANKVISNAGKAVARSAKQAIAKGLAQLAAAAAPVLAQIALAVAAAAAIAVAFFTWLATVIISIVLYAIGFIVFVAIVLFIINSSAYMVPPGENLTEYGEGGDTGIIPEEGCPSGWPTSTGYITQGSYTNSLQCLCDGVPCNGSHSQMEAIDVGGILGYEVFATHGGIAKVEYDSCLGNHVEIKSSCNGREFFSQYAHLSAVSVTNGQGVNQGTVIGISGNTGYPLCSTGPHTHYRFQYSDLTNPSYPDNPPFMMSYYVPRDIVIGCCDISVCGSF